MFRPDPWLRIAATQNAMLSAAARVIQQRLTPGFTPGAGAPAARREYETMVSEKWWALTEAAFATSVAVAQWYARAGWITWQATLGVPTQTGARRAARRVVASGLATAPKLVAAALAPFASRVHANDRRFARRRAATRS